MPVTTVLSEEGSATIIDAGNDNGGMFAHRFSWSAAFAGAFLATAVTFFLLALGAGFGLSLVSAHTTATPTFLTLGAIYFLTAQAFGFAAGGHLAGRLIGPAPETAKEEEFRSAAHGLVVWALAVVATATLVAIGGIVTGNTALSAAANSQKTETAQTMTPSYIGYWVDILFAPGPGPSQASLAWRQYAQADTGAGTDASPGPTQSTTPDNGATAQPMPSGPPRSLEAQPPASTTAITPATSSGVPMTTTTSTAPPATSLPIQPSGPRDQQIPVAPSGFVPPQSLMADKAETGRIIEIGMAKDARLDAFDKNRIAALVAQDTGLSIPDAQRRVDNAETRIYNDETQAADMARKIASHASLWIAFSLLFGAIVSAMAAVSARWEDDRVTFGWPRREPG
jgi:hypothetical protein